MIADMQKTGRFTVTLEAPHYLERDAVFDLRADVERRLAYQIRDEVMKVCEDGRAYVIQVFPMTESIIHQLPWPDHTQFRMATSILLHDTTQAGIGEHVSQRYTGDIRKPWVVWVSKESDDPIPAEKRVFEWDAANDAWKRVA